jgi:hypothetical protein
MTLKNSHNKPMKPNNSIILFLNLTRIHNPLSTTLNPMSLIPFYLPLNKNTLFISIKNSTIEEKKKKKNFCKKETLLKKMKINLFFFSILKNFFQREYY